MCGGSRGGWVVQEEKGLHKRGRLELQPTRCQRHAAVTFMACQILDHGCGLPRRNNDKSTNLLKGSTTRSAPANPASWGWMDAYLTFDMSEQREGLTAEAADGCPHTDDISPTLSPQYTGNKTALQKKKKTSQVNRPSIAKVDILLRPTMEALGVRLLHQISHLSPSVPSGPPRRSCFGRRRHSPQGPVWRPIAMKILEIDITVVNAW